jgi:hypothetical protein
MAGNRSILFPRKAGSKLSQIRPDIFAVVSTSQARPITGRASYFRGTSMAQPPAILSAAPCNLKCSFCFVREGRSARRPVGRRKARAGARTLTTGQMPKPEPGKRRSIAVPKSLGSAAENGHG